MPRDELDGATAPFYPLLPVETWQRIAPDSLVDTFKANLARGLPDFWEQPYVEKWKGTGPIALAGGGPSLAQTLDELREIPALVACGSSHDYLVSQGFKPDFCVICDPAEISATFIKTPQAGCTYLVASHCHPAVFDALRGFDVVLWHSAGAVPDEEMAGLKAVCGGCTVTTRAINLAILMGWSNIHMFGFDSSYAEAGKEHAYSHGFGPREAIEVRVGHKGRVFLSNYEMVAQAQHFQEMLKNFGHLFAPTVHGDGMIAEIMRTPALTEREKYEAMWARDDYRAVAPGEGLVQTAIESLGISAGARVFDFGCGTGRAAQKLHEAGMKVTAFDFAANCRDREFDFAFRVHDLTESLPDKCDFGFCTDVMEHIEPEKVDAVLRNIADACDVGCFFAIYTAEDGFGAVIGEHLHLTVQPAEWWARRLSKLFLSMKWHAEGDRASFVCFKSPRA